MRRRKAMINSCAPCNHLSVSPTRSDQIFELRDVIFCRFCFNNAKSPKIILERLEILVFMSQQNIRIEMQIVIWIL